MFEKLSAANVDQVLIKTAGTLRAQDVRIKSLEAQVAGYKRRDHAEKIAHEAVNRGIMESDEADSYASDLANSAEDLNMVEDFIGRAAAGVPLGRTLEKTAGDHSLGGDGESDVLTSFLLSSDYAG